MTHNTYDRFQGIWLGSIFGQALANGTNRSGLSFDFSSPDWLKQRKQATEILFDTEGLASSRQDKLFQYDNVLSVLPWILIDGDEPDLFKQTIDELYCWTLPAEVRENTVKDIALWNCLLRLLLDTRSPLNFELWCQRAMRNAGVKNSLLVNQLATAIAAVKDGMTLYQLIEKLYLENNLQQTAIALACYCFATTPQEFYLSTTRAANIPHLAWLTAPLTGTLSGAYNGMTGIPIKWRNIAERYSSYHSETKLAVKLFRSWLGVYPADCHKLGDRELHAVAVPRLIQPRESLKIISQTKFSLD